MRRWVFGALSLLSHFCASSAGFAANLGVTFKDLDVYWDAGIATKKSSDQAPILQSPKGQKQRKAIIAGLCTMSQERLLVGKGVGGRGVFENVNCIDPVDAIEEGEEPQASWRLTATEKNAGKAVKLTLSLVLGPGKKPLELGSVDLTGIERLSGCLSDEEYRRALGKFIQDLLPADYAFPQGVKGAGSVAKGAPKSLQLFSLTVDSETLTWRPQAAGTATVKNGTWNLEGEGGPLGYDMTRSTASRDKDREALALMETKLVEAADASVVGKISDLLITQVSAGYVGLRYGRVIVDSSNILLSRVGLLSVVSEFRSGPLEGLRFYYDWIPTVKVTELGVEETFGMNRLVVGWGFGFGFPWLIDRVELVPKLGNWNFAANIPVVTDTGDHEVRSFDLRSGLSFGLEGALEKFSSKYLVRAWASRDFSTSFLGALKSNVTSTRAGIDALIGGPRLPLLGIDFKLAFLLFLLNDHFSIGGTRDAAEGGGQYQITIDAPVAGGGLALTW